MHNLAESQSSVAYRASRSPEASPRIATFTPPRAQRLIECSYNFLVLCLPECCACPLAHLDFCCTLNRQIGRFFALENSTGIVAGHSVRVRYVRSIGYQTAGRSELASLVECGHTVADCQRSKLFAVACEQCIATDHECARPHFNQFLEDSIEVMFTAGIQDLQLQPEIMGLRQHRTLGGLGKSRFSRG